MPLDENPPFDAHRAARLAEALRGRLAAETGGPAELIETHISRILLAGDAAYKLKKPVHLPFADFRDPVARRRFCEEELRLNRRLVPDLYLDVRPVCGTPEAPRIGTADEAARAIDWVLRMRRFPPGRELDALLRRGELQDADIDRFAARLARFHAEAPVAGPTQDWGTPERVAATLRDVLDRLVPLAGGARLQALRGAFERAQPALRRAWAARHAGGHVREGHGDLHLANVVKLGEEVTAFDCIEFDPALRWIDTMADIAFFTMDLKAHGRPGLAWRFLDRYLAHTGDHEGLPVLRPYEAYRALVRELAGRLREAGGAPPAPRPDYLGLAEALAAPAACTPRLLITHGLSGSGKSTVAAALLEAAGAVRLRSDVERKRLFGLGALQRSAAAGLDIYTAEATQRTFERLRQLARTALRAGYPVIVDAAFLRRDERDAFRTLADAQGVPFAVLHCHAGLPALRERVAQRQAGGVDPSEADLGVLARQQAQGEPLAAEEAPFVFDLPTDAPWDAQALALRWAAGGRRRQSAP